MSELLKTGTTTLGIICKDGIVMAADKRATAGNFIVDKKVQKVVPINENLIVTTAGSVSDLQLLMRYLRSEVKLKDIRSSRPCNVSEAANLLAGMVYSNIRGYSMIPGVTHFLIAGRDATTTKLFDIYPDGSITEIDDYVSSGSGSVFVYGILENQYKKNLTLEQGIQLARESIMAALSRDSASGNGMDIFTVTQDGLKKIETRTINPTLA